MPYVIRLQSKPHTVRAELTNKTSAIRAAQMISNGRGEYLAAFDTAVTALWRAVALTGPSQPAPYQYEAESAAADIRDGRSRAKAKESLLAFRAYERECGRNAAQVYAAFRQLLAVFAPGAKLTKEQTEYGLQIRIAPQCPHAGAYVCRLTSYMRPGKQSVQIARDYGTASMNRGQPILSGSWCVYVSRDGESAGCAHTWHGAHEVSCYPVPSADRRNDQFPTP